MSGRLSAELATLDCISGHSSRPQEVSNYQLGLVRECMLHDWYQPEHGSVWVEQKVFNKLYGLKLAPEQQSSMGSNITFNQWALGRSQS